MKLKIKLILTVIMIMSVNISAQNSFELTGLSSSQDNSVFEAPGDFDSNPGNFSSIKDWGISFSYGSELADNMNSSLYRIVLTKSFQNHNISVRYTPGYLKEFIFSTGESIVVDDSSSSSLQSDFTYKELFGIGYSYKLLPNLSAGFSVRYFSETYSQETVSPVFNDTLYLNRDSNNDELNYWNCNFGINYSPVDELSLMLSTVNLLKLSGKDLSADFSDYELEKETGVLLGADYSPFNLLNMKLVYETNTAYQLGLNTFIPFLTGTLGFGATVFHDKYQEPYIAGVIPSLSYSTGFFNAAVSGVKYFSERSTSQSFDSFENNGLHNILNNSYSFDKLVFTFTFKLNTLSTQKVKFIDVDIVRDIYPVGSSSYLDNPFAYGKAVNLTGEPLTVRPYSRIDGLNDEDIPSPNIVISPKDTAEIPFYTIIPESYSNKTKEISVVRFSVEPESNDSDDELEKAILVNGINAWDGKVVNLASFIKRDINFSRNYAKSVLNNYKEALDTLSTGLQNFYSAKYLFNSFVKNLVYTSDPRATGEYVQLPHETIEIKGGDCDDLSVAYSSLLESVGIETALVDYKNNNSIRHVNVLVNTELPPENAGLITSNDKKYIVRKNDDGKDEVWIIIETTSLTDFNTAWEAGAGLFNKQALENLGIAKGQVDIIDLY